MKKMNEDNEEMQVNSNGQEAVNQDKSNWLDMARFVAILAVIFLAIFLFTKYVYGFIVVSGDSMENTMHDGQVGIIQKYDKKEIIKRGDIIVFYSDELNEYVVKRCVALGGDTISMAEGVLKVNGKVVEENYIKEPMTENYDIEEFEVPKNTVFAMGDNRNISYDCRALGPADMKDVTGRLVINLGEYGVTQVRVIIAFVIIILILLASGFVEDKKDAQRRESIPEKLRNYPIDIDSSTCTGEKTIGFRNPDTKELELMELVKSDKEIKAYCKKFGREYKHLLKKQ